MKISVEVNINSPLNKVWSAITDISNSKKMISAILDSEIVNQPEDGLVGLKWRETRKVFGKESTETMWITDSKENEYYKTRAENCGAIYVTKLAVSEANNITTLCMTFSGHAESFFVNLMTSVMGFFIKKSMIKMLTQDLEDIKMFVEQGS